MDERVVWAVVMKLRLRGILQLENDTPRQRSLARLILCAADPRRPPTRLLTMYERGCSIAWYLASDPSCER